MEIISVNCNGCGAPLEVGADTKFVTCSHCGAQLAIKRTASSSYTELLEGIDRKADAITEQLAEITRHNEIERIDREWELERTQFMSTNRNGNRSEPNAIGGLLAAAVGGLFGLFWIVKALDIGGGAFSLFGLVFVALAIYVGVSSVSGSMKYMEAKDRYQRRRAAVLSDKTQ